MCVPRLSLLVGELSDACGLFMRRLLATMNLDPHENKKPRGPERMDRIPHPCQHRSIPRKALFSDSDDGAPDLEREWMKRQRHGVKRPLGLGVE